MAKKAPNKVLKKAASKPAAKKAPPVKKTVSKQERDFLNKKVQIRGDKGRFVWVKLKDLPKLELQKKQVATRRGKETIEKYFNYKASTQKKAPAAKVRKVENNKVTTLQGKPLSKKKMQEIINSIKKVNPLKSNIGELTKSEIIELKRKFPNFKIEKVTQLKSMITDTSDKVERSQSKKIEIIDFNGISKSFSGKDFKARAISFKNKLESKLWNYVKSIRDKFKMQFSPQISIDEEIIYNETGQQRLLFDFNNFAVRGGANPEIFRNDFYNWLKNNND